MKPARYKRITEEILRIKARTVMEIGTWNGDRAVEILRAMMEATGGRGVYYGFDLFEDMTSEKSLQEFNVKKPFPRDAVIQRIEREIPDAKDRVVLFKGDTRITLPGFAESMSIRGNLGMFDLVWIDGGHSIKTIKSDFTYSVSLTKVGGVILLDDYYSGKVSVDTEKFGCNQVIHDLAADQEGVQRVSIFPEKDPVKGGGFVQIARYFA